MCGFVLVGELFVCVGGVCFVCECVCVCVFVCFLNPCGKILSVCPNVCTKHVEQDATTYLLITLLIAIVFCLEHEQDKYQDGLRVRVMCVYSCFWVAVDVVVVVVVVVDLQAWRSPWAWLRVRGAWDREGPQPR